MLLYAELSQGTFDNAEKTADEIWRQMVDTNLNSIYFFARKVGKVTLKQKYGRINIGSIHSTMAMKELPLTAYCATKGEVLMLTKALATGWAKDGIMLTQSRLAILLLEWPKDLLLTRSFQKLLKLCRR